MAEIGKSGQITSSIAAAAESGFAEGIRDGLLHRHDGVDDNPRFEHATANVFSVVETKIDGEAGAARVTLEAGYELDGSLFAFIAQVQGATQGLTDVEVELHSEDYEYSSPKLRLHGTRPATEQELATEHARLTARLSDLESQKRARFEEAKRVYESLRDEYETPQPTEGSTS